MGGGGKRKGGGEKDLKLGGGGGRESKLEDVVLHACLMLQFRPHRPGV